jgi:hypothetical protein
MLKDFQTLMSAIYESRTVLHSEVLHTLALVLASNIPTAIFSGVIAVPPIPSAFYAFVTWRNRRSPPGKQTQITIY